MDPPKPIYMLYAIHCAFFNQFRGGGEAPQPVSASQGYVARCRTYAFRRQDFEAPPPISPLTP